MNRIFEKPHTALTTIAALLLCLLCNFARADDFSFIRFNTLFPRKHEPLHLPVGLVLKPDMPPDEILVWTDALLEIGHKRGDYFVLRAQVRDLQRKSRSLQSRIDYLQRPKHLRGIAIPGIDYSDRGLRNLKQNQLLNSVLLRDAQKTEQEFLIQHAMAWLPEGFIEAFRVQDIQGSIVVDEYGRFRGLSFDKSLWIEYLYEHNRLPELANYGMDTFFGPDGRRFNFAEFEKFARTLSCEQRLLGND